MKQELSIKHESDVATLVVRDGAALPLKEPVVITITGVITTILFWLQKRVSEINQLLCHILVDKEHLTMTLVVDESNFYRTTVISKLEFSEIYKQFGINTDKEWECHELANFIKMNRSFFQDRVIAANVVTELKNFKAKINGEVQKFKDDRAGYDVRRKQTVESNLPEELKVKIQVFKGEKEINLTLEIYIEPVDLGCKFICPEATDYIHEQTDAIFNNQVDEIVKIAPEIAILYI